MRQGLIGDDGNPPAAMKTVIDFAYAYIYITSIYGVLPLIIYTVKLMSRTLKVYSSLFLSFSLSLLQRAYNYTLQITYNRAIIEHFSNATVFIRRVCHRRGRKHVLTRMSAGMSRQRLVDFFHKPIPKDIFLIFKKVRLTILSRIPSLSNHEVFPIDYPIKEY